MQQISLSSPLLAAALCFTLAGCASTSDLGEGPMIARPNSNLQASVLPNATALPTPRESTATAQALTDVNSFIDAGAVGLLSERERSEAASAQFNALQFGRPGAPRVWQGDRGNSGSVTVGPYVRVNNIDCRDFTHTVTAGGQSFSKRGTACREVDGHWSVANAG